MSRTRRILVGTLLMAGTLLAAFLFLGNWLAAGETPQQSEVIVVLGGGMPWRARTAAKLYMAGLAPRIWLMPSDLHEPDHAMQAIGLSITSEHEYNRRILEKLGVPPAAIESLEGGVHTTRDEVLRVKREIERRGVRRLLVVTSTYHLRRVRIVCDKVLQGSTVRIVDAEDSSFDSLLWWTRPRQWVTATHELLSILNTVTGFPLHVFL